MFFAAALNKPLVDLKQMESPSSTVEQLAQEKAERDQRAFKGEVLALISAGKRLVDRAYEFDIESGDTPRELVQLRLYEKVFTRVTEVLPFYQQYQRVFDLHRGEILATMHSDEWLLRGKLSVNIAEGRDPKAQAKAANANLHLSWLYRAAKSWKKDCNAAPGSEDDRFSSRILLHLMRVFHLIATQELDREQLLEIVLALETKLGIVRKPASGAASGSSSGYTRVFEFARNMLSESGIPVSDAPPPNESDFQHMIDNLMNNGMAKGVLSSVLTMVKDKIPGLANGSGEPIDLANALSGAISQVATPEAMEAIKNGVDATLASQMPSPDA